MSEPRLISPMLDHFAMGAPISEHHGVRCCPAMPNDSEKKYIVKIISIPASQVQLEALLLTGAFRSESDALSYFKELADGVEKEVEILKKLAALEGFLPYESCQIVPMEDGVGYEVYLLSPYKRSLEKYMRKHTMTHLNAVNLGLDMCASLAVCRRAGYLYLDLKPENIYISDDNEYRIGDLGFCDRSSLKYASLPDKYRSDYTAPEVADALSAINETVDIYAAGLILYQVYNDGRLPDRISPEEPLAAPAYADYEMAEIILKACAPKPEDRWQDPIEMGQAIVSYMQRNGANDVPIVPPPVVLPEPEIQPEEETPEVPEQAAQLLAAAADDSEQLQLDELMALLSDEEPIADSEDSEEIIEEMIPLDPDDPANLSFMDELVDDETAPAAEMAADIAYNELSEDTSDILAQADDLIAHETPEPVVAPVPIDVPMPPPIVLEAEEAEEETADEAEAAEEAAEETEETETTETSDTAEEAQAPEDGEKTPNADEAEEDDDAAAALIPAEKKPVGKIIGMVLAALAVIALMVGVFFFVRDYYLQTIHSIQLHGNENALTVSIVTDTDESLLSVVCTDTYGNTQTSPVENGKADFTNLNANTLYNIKVQISGFHKLLGSTDAQYATPDKTNVVSFTAMTGAEDGAVILRFTVDGVDPSSWNVLCTAEGESDRTIAATGHMATISGLTVGKEYTFTLTSDTELYIVGNYTLVHTVSPLISAQNLTIESLTNNNLSVVWAAPEGVSVESWTVRCYSESGYDQTQEITGTSTFFTVPDSTQAYTVEVIAKGMTAGSRAYASANSITVSNAKAEILDTTDMQVSWEYGGTAPAGGWLLLYTVDGSTTQTLIRCEDTKATISPYIPGSMYQFTLQTESGVTVFGGSFTATSPEADNFTSYLVHPDRMDLRMCKTPADPDWDRHDLEDADYTNSFAAGEKASFVIQLHGDYTTPRDEITIMYVIRDAEGTLISCESTEHIWYDIWTAFFGEVDIPSLPAEAGSYTIEVYFNNQFVHQQDFKITQ